MSETRLRALNEITRTVVVASGARLHHSGRNDQTNKGQTQMTIDPFREMAAALHSRQGFEGTMAKFSKEAG